jgi:hypothetical protein
MNAALMANSCADSLRSGNLDPNPNHHHHHLSLKPSTSVEARLRPFVLGVSLSLGYLGFYRQWRRSDVSRRLNPHPAH